VAHERPTLRPQQLSPAQERWAAVFTTLVMKTGITAVIPSACCAPAPMKWRGRSDHRVRPGLCHDLLVAMVALTFSPAFGYRSRNTGEGWYLMAGAAGRVGACVYPAGRGRMTVPLER
jgi:hypothetical protein